MDGSAKNAGDSQFISFDELTADVHLGTNQAQLEINPSGHQGFGNLNNDPSGIGAIEDLQDTPDKSQASSQPSFWTIEYYKKFFDVDTNDVVERIKRSMAPHISGNYLETHIRPRPDLYGPFWICVTLVFALGISENMANYLYTAASGTYHWRYDFHIVSYAATLIFLYAWLLPIALWGALKWTSSESHNETELIEQVPLTPGLLELLCLYGYSLAIYIPVAFFWTIQITWLQWALVGVAALLSGGVLLQSLLPFIKGKHKPIYFTVILGLHVLLAAGFMLYFFHFPSKKSVTPQGVVVPSVTVASVVAKAISDASVVNATHNPH
ncbi:protein YIPF1 [Orussus abietinus]|uniref:protein YIPF1 n=1 Tax=Orussus abietinus TaxID=222816 RepID=UPI0006257846|nr:protein YIPF1 [Orussus abietinus]